jgi:tetratricopeptide (TPR) repeat protein
VNIELAENFILSFYASDQHAYYAQEVADYNKSLNTDVPLKVSNKDMTLSNDLIVMHLNAINELSKVLEANPQNADAYFLRATNYALVQDFENAISDYNKALFYRPNFMLAYFSRANVRCKMLKFANSESVQGESDRQTKLNYEMVLRDYDMAVKLSPRFAYAYVNKANFLVENNSFQEAILNYTQAIMLEPDLAEAYFNRGLVYILIGDKEKGLKDLGKAGELGIYVAYNIIKRYS